MPLTPDERRAINRENARHSTGPKSEDGKARSRHNALGATGGLPTSVFGRGLEGTSGQATSGTQTVSTVRHLGQ